MEEAAKKLGGFTVFMYAREQDPPVNVETAKVRITRMRHRGVIKRLQMYGKVAIYVMVTEKT